MPFGPADGGVIDIRDQIVLAHPDLGLFADHLVHPFHDPRGAAHIFKLGRGFHRTLPVHQSRGVLDIDARQPRLQRQKRRSGKVIVVQLEPDACIL